MGRQEQCLTFLLSPEPSAVPGSPWVPIWGFGPSTEGSGYLRGGMTATGADLIKENMYSEIQVSPSSRYLADSEVGSGLHSPPSR